jgi:hypothetical protein
MVCILSELGTSTRNLVKNSCKNGLHSEKGKKDIYYVLFVGWFLRLISWLVLFCCKRKIL